MDNGGDINKPGEDVVVSKDFTGSIRCRNLEVPLGVSVVGTAVVEDTARIAGSFEGVLDTDTFLASPTAKARGTLYAQNASFKKSDFKMFLDSDRQAVFKQEAAPSGLHREELFSMAIGEAIAGHVEAALPAPAPEVEPPQSTSLGLAERLASKGLLPLAPPVEPEHEAEAADSGSKPRTSRMTALPSLV